MTAIDRGIVGGIVDRKKEGPLMNRFSVTIDGNEVSADFASPQVLVSTLSLLVRLLEQRGIERGLGELTDTISRRLAHTKTARR